MISLDDRIPDTLSIEHTTEIYEYQLKCTEECEHPLFYHNITVLEPTGIVSEGYDYKQIRYLMHHMA